MYSASNTEGGGGTQLVGPIASAFKSRGASIKTSEPAVHKETPRSTGLEKWRTSEKVMVFQGVCGQAIMRRGFLARG